jgi:hypothetical protein
MAGQPLPPPPPATSSQTELNRTDTVSTSASGMIITEPTKTNITPTTSNPIGSSLSPTSTASSAGFLRGRSNSALPKLTTSVSTHLPWKTSGPSTTLRNQSGHRSSQSVSGAGVTAVATHKNGKLHLPHLSHGLYSHSSSHVPTQKTIFGRQAGAGALAIPASPLISEVQLPTSTSAEPTKPVAMMDLGKRISNRFYQTKSATGSSSSLALNGLAKKRELANWAEDEEREKRKAEARDR